jgi:hypothetical protein
MAGSDVTYRGSTSLVSATKSDRWRGPFWGLTLYPTAGEAGGSVRLGMERKRGAWREPEPEDGDRAASEAARRARGKLRRYGTANGLNRLGTLTYAGGGCFDPVALRADIRSFFRKLERGLRSEDFPYMWVPEWHPGGHGLHAHFGVGQYVRRGLIESSWGRGIVHIKLLGNLPLGSGRFEEGRRASRYLAKYVGKDFDHDRVPGLHRYDVARGFEPERVPLVGPSWEDVVGQASNLMGSEPSVVWRSDGAEGWQGPPAGWASWTR